MSNPILNERTHRLSDLPGIKHPDHCQKCGASRRVVSDLAYWIECDHRDKPFHTGLMLCGRCSGQIIDPHPRLYIRLHANDPRPGAMQLCVACIHRDGVGCKHPRAKANGGLGVKIKMGQVTTGFVDGAKYSGPFRMFHEPPKACDGRELNQGPF